VLTHKPRVIVASVSRYADAAPKDLDSFAKVLRFLTFARDGVNAPDVFYLGQLLTLSGRFCARLDSLHTIELPSPGEPLRAFLKEQRVATLHADFLHELHIRLFNAFASAGFDDHAWLSTHDLDWLVKQGRADSAALQQTVHQLEALKASRIAEGKQFAENELTAAHTRLTELFAALVPYEQELARRTGA
jgi:hypothetical protein